MKPVVVGCAAGLLALTVAAGAAAQESKSAALAKQLAQALEAGKMDSVAAKDPSAPDVFDGVLYLPGELLVVSAKYAAPQLMIDRLTRKEYKDVYIDLNSASVAATKVFIEDLGADGLRVDPESNHPFDTYEAAGKRTMFNGDWKAQKVSEQDYKKTFAGAEDQYERILTALLAQLKQTS